LLAALQPARRLLDEGHFDEARRSAAEVASAHPDALQPALLLVQIDLAASGVAPVNAEAPGSEALTRIESQLVALSTRFPESAEVWRELGSLRLLLGEPEAARKALGQAVSLAPKDAESQSLLGVAALSLGDVAGAVRQLRLALELDPSRGERAANLGRALMAAGQIQEASLMFGRAARLLPQDARVASDLGTARLALGETEAGLQELRRAVAMSPKQATFHNNLGYGLHQSGQEEAAEAEIRKALALDSRLVSAWLNLATVLTARGDVPGARAALKSARALAPEDPRVSASEADLQEATAKGPPPSAPKKSPRAPTREPGRVGCHEWRTPRSRPKHRGNVAPRGALRLDCPAMPLQPLSRFFAHDIWQADVDSVRGLRGYLLKCGRLFALAIRGFWKDEGLHRASALAFDTVLGLLPAMVLAVSVMKGFGAYGPFVHDTLEPALNDLFASMGDHADSGNVTLRAAFFKVFELVEATEFKTLGWVGLVFVLYIVVLMLFSVEQSLNHVFGVERSRSVARKFADFSAILLISPLCGMVAATAATHARNFEWAGHGLVLRFLAVAVMSLGLALLYTIMPFTRVRFRSGMLGGFVAGLLWFVVLAFHVRFQIGVARYNALYSTFAAIPIFFVWVFISWLVVLFGAELAAADNNLGAYRWRVRGGDAGAWARSYVALRALVEIGDAFERRLPPRTMRELSLAVGAPDGLIKDVLDPLVDHGALAQVVVGKTVAYVLGGDPQRLSLEEVLAVIECKDQKEGLDRVVDADERVETILNRIWGARASLAERISVRDLVTQVQSLPPPSRRSADLQPSKAPAR